MKQRLFLILWLAGILGVLSFLFIDLSALIAALPLRPGEPSELPHPALLKLASILQPAVLTTIAVLVGVLLAGPVGLHSPTAEAWANGEDPLVPLRRQIAPGITAGLAGGAVIALSWVIVRPFLSNEFIDRAEGFNNLVPHAVRLLYGGITEEILLHWGFMTFLMWAGWRFLQKGTGELKPVYFVAAIILSSLLFGVGHLLSHHS